MVMIVVAIGNIMEFAANRYTILIGGKIGFVFIQSKIRMHLIKFLKQNYTEPSAKEIMREPRCIKVATIEIDLFCCCSVQM